MKHPKVFWSLVATFVALLSAWLYAGKYPYPIYECHQTNKLLEYLDRLSGWEVNCTPIYVPDNPLWVTIIRKVAPITLFGLFLAILAVRFEGTKPKEKDTLGF